MGLTPTTKKEEEGRKRKKDEEREVPDPRESIEDTPIINFYQVSSKSDFREPNVEQIPGSSHEIGACLTFV